MSVVAKPFTHHDLSDFGGIYHPKNPETIPHVVEALHLVGEWKFHPRFVELYLALACQDR